jgi:WD40-like Beta Propeller Repeat
MSGLGSVSFLRRGKAHVVDLATCRDHVVRRSQSATPIVSPDGRWQAAVRSSGKGKTAKQTIWVTDRRTGKSHPVFSETEYYKTIGPGETPGPIVLLRWSGDDRWIFFSIDPGGSGSIQADGLTLRVVSAKGGRAIPLERMLLYPDYLAWCGGRLVFTAGMDRVATHTKRLLVAAPPQWRPRPLVVAPRRAWGSLVCARDERSVVVQSQPETNNPSFFATHWSLWRVGLDGHQLRLTSPPRGYTDESPRFSPDGRAVLFVRSRNGVGRLYALRNRRLVGPLLSLGFNTGFYGHHAWWLD